MEMSKQSTPQISRISSRSWLATCALSVPVAFSEEAWNLGRTLPVANIIVIDVLSLLFVRIYIPCTTFSGQNHASNSIALEDPPGKEIITALQAAYTIDRHRTVEQDSAFGIRQIVDMALKALSPGINDTTTAVMCVDYLSAILAGIATREIPSSYRYEDGLR